MLKKKLINFVIEKRKALGMTQAEFSEHVFGDKRYQNRISNLENGKRGTSTETLIEMLEKLNCDLDILEN
ncbi:helix-turn-helix transcriptional regulator [Wenyingzhuangia sp. 2_MG-2023]|uniref:helix-turn-helix domain-containing protein n=1 Tax=Wenyingzhuangia sp. 2_MG-2023 TaxID=3062639 RepID=UPI0026E2FDFF|nr:helix-turn-helix transcriptional regulator [Wenyingzhuangia sp. 2_MG-2023]MDO6737053.1 helix-turn-helix transcriptional regulator [Wenyingzhuangia sp. 2_MG-2023]